MLTLQQRNMDKIKNSFDYILSYAQNLHFKTGGIVELFSCFYSLDGIMPWIKNVLMEPKYHFSFFKCQDKVWIGGCMILLNPYINKATLYVYVLFWVPKTFDSFAGHVKTTLKLGRRKEYIYITISNDSSVYPSFIICPSITKIFCPINKCY